MTILRDTASVKRSRSQDQANSVSKRARSELTSQRSLSPKRDYPRGTSTITKPTPSSPINVEDRLVQAQDLAYFKTDMTSLIQDMIQSILSLFASQLKANSASKGDYSQDQAQEISRDPGQGLEQDQVDQVDPPEEEGELASEDDEDPVLQQGDPDLSELVLSEEEQRDMILSMRPQQALRLGKGKPHYGSFPRRIQNFTHKSSRLVARLMRRLQF